MGRRIVRVSTELLKEFFVQGRTFPSRGGMLLRVVSGVPEDAELEAVSGDLYADSGEVALRFSSPSWDGPDPGHAIPELRVEYGESQVPHFEVMHIRPDDVVVARLHGPASQVAVHRIRECLTVAFPNNKGVVLEDSVSLCVVSPTDTPHVIEGGE